MLEQSLRASRRLRRKPYAGYALRSKIPLKINDMLETGIFDCKTHDGIRKSRQTAFKAAVLLGLCKRVSALPISKVGISTLLEDAVSGNGPRALSKQCCPIMQPGGS